MTIIVDAMGDHAPAEVVEGALLAVDELDCEIILVGDEALLAPMGLDHPRLRVAHAPDVIEMGEHPAKALKRKPGSSIAVGMRLAKETPGSAFVSAGSTGAVLAGALLILKRLPGVERPPIASVIPTLSGGGCVLADMGANVDCKPSQIGQFAVLAAAYASFLLGVEEPRVGLLNIGTEVTKGNEQAQAAHHHLAGLEGLRFAGNVEPGDVYSGQVDAVVTDGYAGNIFLKTSEAVVTTMRRLLELPDGGAAEGDVAQRLARFDPHSGDYGGAPLLGVNGTVIVVHGAARSSTIRDAIRAGARAAASGYLDHLRSIYMERSA